MLFYALIIFTSCITSDNTIYNCLYPHNHCRTTHCHCRTPHSHPGSRPNLRDGQGKSPLQLLAESAEVWGNRFGDAVDTLVCFGARLDEVRLCVCVCVCVFDVLKVWACGTLLCGQCVCGECVHSKCVWAVPSSQPDQTDTASCTEYSSSAFARSVSMTFITFSSIIVKFCYTFSYVTNLFGSVTDCFGDIQDATAV